VHVGPARLHRREGASREADRHATRRDRSVRPPDCSRLHPPAAPSHAVGGFALGLIFAALMTGLFTLGGAALLEHRVLGEGAVAGEDPPLSCTAFQVGSPHAADTHIHLKNAGPESISVRLDFVDDSGLGSWAATAGRHLEPWASHEVAFRTPALGAAVKLTSPGWDLRAGAEIRRDDGGPPGDPRGRRVPRPIGPAAGVGWA